MTEKRNVTGRNRPGQGAIDAAHAADYLADLLPSLARIANGAGFNELAFLLEMAVMEASSKKQDPQTR